MLSSPIVLDSRLLTAAAGADGFMPADEGRALAEAALAAPAGPILEVGSYLGKSTLYLAAAARARGGKVVTVDHHRGSEEHQVGWEYHDPGLVDPAVGMIDTLPGFRRAIAAAGAEDVVVAVVARAEDFAALWSTPLAFLFLDGSHTDESAQRDLHTWTPHLAPGGVLAIHDVFPDPADGGQAPYRIYRKALDSGDYREITGCGSLRLLVRSPAS
jgi:predicted O-methyltransferase YrrM